MEFFTLGYYNQVKDYLHPHLHDFIHYYRRRNILHLPLYHGSNKKNRNGVRKLIEYNQGHQCIVPTNNLYWRKAKDKYKRIGSRNTKRVYWTRIYYHRVSIQEGLNIGVNTSELMLGNYDKEIYKKM